MKKDKPIYCERCGEFINNIGNLIECPICGWIFDEVVTEQKQEDDE